MENLLCLGVPILKHIRVNKFRCQMPARFINSCTIINAVLQVSRDNRDNLEINFHISPKYML